MKLQRNKRPGSRPWVRTHRPSHGFSLLEVLIAMAVISLALLALSRTGGGVPLQMSGLEERTLAQWVAQNAISELRLREDFPPPGSREGREEMGQRDWTWRAQIQNTDDPNMRRIDVSVYIDGDTEATAAHTGFVGRF